LSMVSTPAYDANAFVKGISRQEYASLSDSLDLPLFNRSLQGQYPPGSTIKPLLVLAGLYNQVIDRYTTVVDPGWYQLPNDNRLYRDWKRTGHGDKVNAHVAIVESCDVYFCDLAFTLGIDRIYPFLSYFQLGEQTGVDSTGEASGLLPSRSWKRAIKKQQWFPGETLNVGIGQGYMLVTPLQLAVSTAMIANRGRAVSPHLVRNVSLVKDRSKFLAEANQYLGQISSDHWQQIQVAMKDVIHSPKGTANRIAEGLEYVMAGKTGTAQVIGIAQGEKYNEEEIAERQRDHALFVGYAPYDKPKIALSVIVENGGSGSATAAPIAREIFDWYLLKDQQTQPVSPQGLYVNLENGLSNYAQRLM